MSSSRIAAGRVPETTKAPFNPLETESLGAGGESAGRCFVREDLRFSKLVAPVARAMLRP